MKQYTFRFFKNDAEVNSFIKQRRLKKYSVTDWTSSDTKETLRVIWYYERW